MIYVTDGQTEHIEGEGYRSDDYSLYTFLLKFFDMIIDKETDESVYSFLTGIPDGEKNFEDACEYLPLFRLMDSQSESFMCDIKELFDIYECGREVLQEIFAEQRIQEETLYKTLFLRSMNEKKRGDDLCFFKQIKLRNALEPISSMADFFGFVFNKLAVEVGRNDNRKAAVYIGQCERCGTHYPIRRIQHGALAKNHFCPACRDIVSSVLTKESRKDSPIYAEYQKLYNRYYQQYRRLNNIDYQQLRDYMMIAGRVRDDFLAKDINDRTQYKKEVEKQIEEWNNK